MFHSFFLFLFSFIMPPEKRPYPVRPFFHFVQESVPEFTNDK